MPVWIIPIRDGWLAYARPMCAFSLRADIDGRLRDMSCRPEADPQGWRCAPPLRAAAALTARLRSGEEAFMRSRQALSTKAPNAAKKLDGNSSRLHNCKLREKVLLKLPLAIC